MAPTDLYDIQKFPTSELKRDDPVHSYHSSVEAQLMRLSTDAGFVKTVALGRYFTTRDAEEFSEFDGHVACREYNLPRNYASSTLKRLDS